MNVHWMVLCFLCRSEIQDGCHHRTIWGKYRNIFFSEAIALIEPKLCINHWKVLYKLCVFYVDRNSKMTTTAGHSFYIGPIGSFYNQVNDTGSWEPLVVIRTVSPLPYNLDSSYLVHTLMIKATCLYISICYLSLISVAWYFDPKNDLHWTDKTYICIHTCYLCQSPKPCTSSTCMYNIVKMCHFWLCVKFILRY